MDERKRIEEAAEKVLAVCGGADVGGRGVAEQRVHGALKGWRHLHAGHLLGWFLFLHYNSSRGA